MDKWRRSRGQSGVGKGVDSRVNELIGDSVLSFCMCPRVIGRGDGEPISLMLTTLPL